MNVLSLFDGMSGTQIALERIGFSVDSYYASEIDKYAIAVTQYNYPQTIQLGDINNWREWDIDWSSIDLIVGGSPCQGLSQAGRGAGLEDSRSKLFFVFVDILEHVKSMNPSVFFLLENVVPKKKEWAQNMTTVIGVEPIMIDSALLSAQSRKRLYWTNLEVEQPEDKNIYLINIIESVHPDSMKSYCIDASYFKGGNLKQYFEKSRRQLVFENGLSFVMGLEQGRRLDDGNYLSRNYGEGYRIYSSAGKSSTLTSQSKGGLGGHSGLYLVPKLVQEGYINQNHRGSRYYNINGKSVTLAANGGGWGMKTGLYLIPTTKNNLRKTVEEMLADGDAVVRKLTPIECERLQTVPDEYTSVGDFNGNVKKVSNTQRYKMLGNGFTVDVIAHILKNIKDEQCN